MAETKELKPRSFRIDEETAEKFKVISAELGNNQQQTLSKLIETYEFQKGKAVLTKKKEEIETFEKYVTILTRMYMQSLENNENVTVTVQAEFDALLGSKDQVIVGLQEELKAAKLKEKEHQEAAKSYKDETEETMRTVLSLEAKLKEQEASSERALEDKEQLIKALSQACDGYKKDAEDYQKATLERNVMATKQMQLQKELKELEERNSALKTQLEQETLSRERALLAQEKEFARQLQEFEQARKAEIDNYQNKYLELLQQLQQKSEIATEVSEKKEENK